MRMLPRSRAFAWMLATGCAWLFGSAAECAQSYLQPPEPAAIETFVTRLTAARAALDSDSTEAAVARFAELAALVPDSPVAPYYLAAAHLRQDKPAAARAALARAVELGFAEAEQAASDPTLEALRTDPGWQDLLGRMRANREQGREALRRLVADPPRGAEPEFGTLDSLRVHYANQERRAYASSRIYGTPAMEQMLAGVTLRKIAALERFRKAHPEAPLAYPAAMEELTTRASFAEMVERPWTLGREGTAEFASQILALYPDSAGAALAALWRVRADLYAKMHGDPPDLPAAECDGAIARLQEVAGAYPRTPGGCQALAEAIAVTAQCSGQDPERMQPLFAQLEAGCPLDRETLADFFYRLNEFRLMIRGVPDFSAADIDGRTWRLGDLRGRVVLLDFWATWCGPCLAEMPNVIRLRERYPEDRLVILGISLDRSDRLSVDAFRAWLLKRRMPWPQIYDGKAWQAEIARLYDVKSIPFPVLIDADGAVVAAGEGARGKNLEAKLAELLAS